MEQILKRRPQLIDRVMMRIDRRMMTNSTGSIFLPVSSFLQERFRERFDPLPGVWRVVPPGVDLEHFAHQPHARAEIRARLAIPTTALTLLFVGMNFRTKGLRLLIDALARVPQAPGLEPVRLLVVGRGDCAPYRAQAQQLGVETRIHFVGPVADPAAWYSAADAFALLSDFETYGMVVAEAMAAGLPVLITDQMGARDLVCGSQAGVILRSPTPDEVAQSIARLQNPQVRADMARDARAKAETLSWDRTAEACAGAYEEILARRARH